MAKIKKTPPPSTIDKPVSKGDMNIFLHAFNDPDADLYVEKERRSLNEMPVGYFRRIGKDLIAHAEKDTTFSFQEYFNNLHITPASVSRWRKQDKFFNHACDLAKEIIGNRREFWAASNKMNAFVMMQSLPGYTSLHRELQERKAELAQKNQQAQGNVTVVYNSPVKSSPPESYNGSKRSSDEHDRENDERNGRPALGDQSPPGEISVQRDTNKNTRKTD